MAPRLTHFTCIWWYTGLVLTWSTRAQMGCACASWLNISLVLGFENVQVILNRNLVNSDPAADWNSGGSKEASVPHRAPCRSKSSAETKVWTIRKALQVCDHAHLGWPWCRIFNPTIHAWMPVTSRTVWCSWWSVCEPHAATKHTEYPWASLSQPNLPHKAIVTIK